jgi:hypothetical protein
VHTSCRGQKTATAQEQHKPSTQPPTIARQLSRSQEKKRKEKKRKENMKSKIKVVFLFLE